MELWFGVEEMLRCVGGIVCCPFQRANPPTHQPTNQRQVGLLFRPLHAGKINPLGHPRTTKTTIKWQRLPEKPVRLCELFFVCTFATGLLCFGRGRVLPSAKPLTHLRHNNDPNVRACVRACSLRIGMFSVVTGKTTRTRRRLSLGAPVSAIYIGNSWMVVDDALRCVALLFCLALCCWCRHTVVAVAL